ncbi:MAG TPA: RNA methyltransferase [Acidimicrobiales bacterium]
MIPVEDPDDPRLDDFRGLRLREDRHLDHFVIEGYAAVAELLHSPYTPRAVLVLDRKAARIEPLVDGFDRLDVPVYVAPESVMRTTMGFNLHRGIIASAHRTALPDAESLLERASSVAVLERLNDHENLGSLFRNARAFGIDAVLLDPQTADPLYRRCVRVSMGHVLRVPFARFDAWPDGVDLMQSLGFTVVALTPSRDAMSIDEVATSRPDKVAILLGAEGPGLDDESLVRADMCVRVPMADDVDSLNVATAAAIAFHRLVPGS